MNFDELNSMLPYVKGGKQKSLSCQPYPNITLLFPGRHAEDTIPKGGDFVVCVDDKAFNRPKHQFTHDDIFKQVENKNISSNGSDCLWLMPMYYNVVQGQDIEVADNLLTTTIGMNNMTFLHAVQCLAVAEHRRYKQYEAKFGGRYLPFRAAAGIADGKWTAEEATTRTRRGGRLGVEWLEAERGMPELTRTLMGK